MTHTYTLECTVSRQLAFAFALLSLTACSSTPEVEFIDAHGCGGATTALHVGEAQYILRQEACGYAIEFEGETVGCMVVEHLSINGLPLGSGAIPPSHEACYAEGFFGPFRPWQSGDGFRAPASALRLEAGSGPGDASPDALGGNAHQ
jgi:hypothetical protein